MSDQAKEELTIEEQLQGLEGLLYVCGEEGVDLDQIQVVFDLESRKEAKKLVKKLERKYIDDERGLMIISSSSVYKLTTLPRYSAYYQKLLTVSKTRLSNAMLEVLSIIAYKQPVTRIEVEKIRAVSCDVVVRKLLALSLVKEAGRADTVGRPKLYKTTDDFLDYFGISDLSELPELLDDIEADESEDTDLFQSKYREDGVDEEEEAIEAEPLLQSEENVV